MHTLRLWFAVAFVAAGCGSSGDSGGSDVDGGVDSVASDTFVVDAPKDTSTSDVPMDTTPPTDTAATDSTSSDTSADDTATTDTAATDSIALDVPLDVREGGLEAGAHCTSDLECASGLKCCYPCGVPGCSNECIPPAPSGSCPLFP